MHSSSRLVVNVCVAIVLCACSSGRRALRPGEARDAAPGPSLPEVSSPPEADAFSNRGDIRDGLPLLPEVLKVTCGNGRLDPGEACDDGNTLPGDGCTPTCQLDDECLFGPCKHPTTSCGDARITGNEGCDDGNSTSGDGCSAECEIEPGWICRVPGKKCVPFVPLDAGLDLGYDHGVCGDGVISLFEECDCGNGSVPVPDGCEGPNADGTYGGCTTRCLYGSFCGDGQVNGAEECDLGRDNGQLSGKNGCTLACRQTHYCGDGFLDESLGERCDLGPLNGVRLDQNFNPSTDPGAKVYCLSDCQYLI